MSFIIIFLIIFTFSVTLTILLKKRIEQVIPISVVFIVLIIYVAGLFDHLQIGVDIIYLLTIIQLIFIITTIIKKDKNKTLKDMLKNITTPGLVIYLLLFIISIKINQNRIFEDYDEFNHWAVIIKNMFTYNTYGTNPETIVRFNEYPPFTAVFQYLFLAIQNLYREDIIITANNILYFSIIIPITKCINWNKSLKKALLIIPAIIFIPMFFYENFFLDILVDGLIGVMFAYIIFSAFEQGEDIKFKYIKILSGELMLCLTKSSGIGLAILSMLIILLNIIINRKKDKKIFKQEMKWIVFVTLVTLIFTSMWYVKVSNAEKRWDFNEYIKVDNNKKEYQKEIAKIFTEALFLKQDITEREMTVFSVILIFIAIQLYTVNKVQTKGYKYYSSAMIISILLYLMGLLITYATIFDLEEAQQLTSYDRYISTILLSYSIFQMFVISQIDKKSYAKDFVFIMAIILIFMPLRNVEEKYIHRKNDITTSIINRDIYTKIRNYADIINKEDEILYIVGTNINARYMKAINEYQIMPIQLKQTIPGAFESYESFINIINGYDYVFIYRIKDEMKEKIQEAFIEEEIKNDTLYKVSTSNGAIILEEVK